MKKIVVVALGHRALGTTLPEQKVATPKPQQSNHPDLVEERCQGGNLPQQWLHRLAQIHTAMNEFGKTHPDYTFAPMSVCSAMSQGYIGLTFRMRSALNLSATGIYKLLLPFLPRLL